MSVAIAEDRRQLIKDMIHEFSKRLLAQEGNNLLQIVVYGSVARGEERDGSDIDIFVLLDNYDYHAKDRIYDLAYAVGSDMSDHTIEISPLVLGSSGYEKARHEELLFHFISEEGAVIYDADA